MIRVKAAPGLRVPMEGSPRKYIEADPVSVPETAYYRRRLAEGDLVRAGGDQTGKTAKGGK